MNNKRISSFLVVIYSMIIGVVGTVQLFLSMKVPMLSLINISFLIPLIITIVMAALFLKVLEDINIIKCIIYAFILILNILGNFGLHKYIKYLILSSLIIFVIYSVEKIFDKRKDRL